VREYPPVVAAAREAPAKSGLKPEVGRPLVLKMADFTGEKYPILAASRKAGSLGRMLVVYFCAPENAECAKMDAALSAPKVKGLVAKHFACLRIDQKEHSATAKFYGCKRVPFLMVFNSKGDVTASTEKAVDADALRKLLEEGLAAGKTESRLGTEVENEARKVQEPAPPSAGGAKKTVSILERLGRRRAEALKKARQ